MKEKKRSIIYKKPVWTIVIFAGIILSAFPYVFCGTIYSNKKAEQYHKQALVKADINKNSTVEVEEAIKAYLDFGDDNEKLLSRISLGARHNFYKNHIFQSNIPNELKKYLLDNFNFCVIHEEGDVIYEEEDREYFMFKRLVDRNHNGLELEEIVTAFKIGYGEKGVTRLEFNDIYPPEKSVWNELLLPFWTYKDTELERYIKGN